MGLVATLTQDAGVSVVEPASFNMLTSTTGGGVPTIPTPPRSTISRLGWFVAIQTVSTQRSEQPLQLFRVDRLNEVMVESRGACPLFMLALTPTGERH